MDHVIVINGKIMLCVSFFWQINGMAYSKLIQHFCRQQDFSPANFTDF